MEEDVCGVVGLQAQRGERSLGETRRGPTCREEKTHQHTASHVWRPDSWYRFTQCNTYVSVSFGETNLIEECKHNHKMIEHLRFDSPVLMQRWTAVRTIQHQHSSTLGSILFSVLMLGWRGKTCMCLSHRDTTSLAQQQNKVCVELGSKRSGVKLNEKYLPPSHLSCYRKMDVVLLRHSH